MTWYLKSVAAVIPPLRDSAAVAVAEGRYESSYATTTGFESVAIAGDVAPIDLAAAAARRALAAKGVSPESLDFLTVSSIHRHGHPQLWVPAAGLQNALSANRALAFALHHGCNSQFIALELLLRTMTARPGSLALIAGADVFSGSGFDRWRSDYVAYGDAATAMLVGDTPGFARIDAIASISAPQLERMHRHDRPFSENPTQTYDIRATKKSYLEKTDGQALIEATSEAVRDLVRRVGSNDADHIIFPNLGIKVLTSSYYPAFPRATDRSTWTYGKTVGHLGTSDALASLVHLRETGQLKQGQTALLVGAGAGFSWSLTALTIMEDTV